MSAIKRLTRRGPFFLLPLVLVAAAVRRLIRFMSAVRLRAYGVALGDRVHVGPRIRFVMPWRISIGNHCVLGANIRFWSEKEDGEARLSEQVEVGRDCVLDFTGGLYIERGALLSEGCIIYTHDHGYDPHSAPVAQSLTIGEGAWLGARVIVLPSFRRIDARSVIGAGAAIAKDIPDSAICVSASIRLISRHE